MIEELALFGGDPLFKQPKSTSNLIKPNKKTFKEYLLKSFTEESSSNNNGGLIQQFEYKFAKLHDVKYCIPVVNGLWALVITINELKKEGKSEIIIPSLTYRRMADIAAWIGLVPRFCDVDSENFAVSRAEIESCITDQTAIVLAPHSIVNVCDVKGISELCREKSLPLLFDSVESYYANINGKRVGSFGEAECFSLHASKFLNGFEGGYVTTNDEQLAKRLRLASSGGKVSDGEILNFGLNLQLSEYHAAMALSCIDEIDAQINHNKSIYKTYKNGINNIRGLKIIEYDESERRSFKNILVEIEDGWRVSREILIEIMHAENIIARPYYTPPLHEMERDYPTVYEFLPNTDYWKTRLLMLPSGYFVSEKDVNLVLELLEFCQKKAPLIIEKYKKYVRRIDV